MTEPVIACIQIGIVWTKKTASRITGPGLERQLNDYTQVAMNMKYIKRIIVIITTVSTLSGIIAFIRERVGESSSSHQPYGFYERYIKRPLDAFLSTGALLVFSPILLITALLVRLKLGSPVFFTQDRPGRDGKIFKLYKFRTMTDKKDAEGKLLPDEDRLPAFGRKLRSTSLDEMPELFNMIKGDMSVVGPRPLLVQYLPRYNKHQARRHEVRPGFTGLAQVNGRNDLTWEEKFDWDVRYVDRITFLGDVKIVLKTVWTVVKKEGISSDHSATMEEFMGEEKS